MAKAVKKSEHKGNNQNKRLIDTQFQNIIKTLKKNQVLSDLEYISGDFGLKRKAALLNALDRHNHKLTAIGAKSAALAFVKREVMPFGNYNELDSHCDLRIGAALWILDKLKRNAKIYDAYDLLPDDSSLNLDYWYLPPDFSHPCFSNDLINSVIHLITRRYPQGRLSGCVITPENARGVKPVNVYTRLLELLPEHEVSEACRSFKEKIEDISLRYVRADGYFNKRIKAVEDTIDKSLISALKVFDSSYPEINDLMKTDIITQNTLILKITCNLIKMLSWLKQAVRK